MQVNIANIPSAEGKIAMDVLKTQLDEKLNLGALLPEKTIGVILKAAEHLDQITLGWSKH